MSHVEDIRKHLKEGKVLIGTKQVISNLKTGNLKKVYVSSNTPEDIKNQVTKYAELASVDVVQLKQANDELGTICKKPFMISLLGVQ